MWMRQYIDLWSREVWKFKSMHNTQGLLHHNISIPCVLPCCFTININIHRSLLQIAPTRRVLKCSISANACRVLFLCCTRNCDHFHLPQCTGNWLICVRIFLYVRVRESRSTAGAHMNKLRRAENENTAAPRSLYIYIYVLVEFWCVPLIDS